MLRPLMTYSRNVAKYGLMAASRHAVRIYWHPRRDRVINSLLQHRVECPCCGWTGRQFKDYYFFMGDSIPRIECPRCESHPRHRLLYLWLERAYRINDRKGRALLLAPEKALANCWKAAPGLATIGMDIERKYGAEVLADVRELPFPSGSMDIIWCHHVLAQLPDDSPGMLELKRVLNPEGGELVISENLSRQGATVEFGRRREDFSNEWRHYGQDFCARLRRHGLEPQEVAVELSDEEIRRFGITTEQIFLCRPLRIPSHTVAMAAASGR